MSLTKSKIQSALTKFEKKFNKDYKQKYGEDPEYSFEGFCAEELFDNIVDEESINGLKFEFEESHGGNEGGGDHCHQVFKVTDVETNEECYIKFDGFYSSYEGSNYDEGFYIADYDLVQVKKWKKKGSK
jgi:hypothetical protein